MKHESLVILVLLTGVVWGGSYEAESADYFGAESVARAQASGGYCLRLFDEAGDYVNYQNVTAGNVLQISFSNQEDASRCSVYVNGEDVATAVFPTTGSWYTFDIIRIGLDIAAGDNVKLQVDADDRAWNEYSSCATQDKIDVLTVDPMLDSLIFGNAFSEVFTHTTSYTNTLTGTGQLNQSYRKMTSTDVTVSSMTFTLACDPDVQNYLTLKFWGGDTLYERQYLYLYDGSTQIGSYGSDVSEIVNWADTAPSPGRFVYVTYMVPESMTAGKSSVNLKLGGCELPIYRAYLHTNSFFEPFDTEAQGSQAAFNGPYPAVGGKTVIEHIHDQLDLAIDRFLTWQYYGPEWDSWVANGWGPAMMTGSVNIHGAKDQTWTEQEYKDTWSARQEAHVRAQMVIEVYALAYHAEWSKHYHDPELIDRVVKALDFLRLAQGSDGGYVELENWSGRWIGAPNRTNGIGCLMGFGMKGGPGAFLAMQNEIVSGGYLDGMIDDDDNESTPDITRREAYADLFVGIRSYLTSPGGRGHASNQDVVDLTAAYLADMCVTILDPSQAWSAATRNYYLDVCYGFEDGIYGGPWMSDKGISMEANGLARGGFCGGYGEHNVEHLTRLAVLTGNQTYADYARLHFESMAKMRYRSHDESLRPTIRREGWNSWRHTYVPGSEAYGDEVPMAAVLLGDENVLRSIQLAVADGAYYKLDFSNYWVHMMSITSRWMRQIDYLEQALAMPATDERFPFEDGEPDFAWADEEAALVILKQGDIRFNASIQWRHPLCDGCSRHPDNARVNDKVRVHYTTDEYDRLGTVEVVSPQGMYGLYVWEYGDYLIGMNASHDTAYEMTLPAVHPPTAVDLISGQLIDLTTNPVIQPQNTLIFDFYEPTYCGDRGTVYSLYDLDYDCDVNMDDFLLMAEDWLTVYDLSDFAEMAGEFN